MRETKTETLKKSPSRQNCCYDVVKIDEEGILNNWQMTIKLQIQHTKLQTHTKYTKYKNGKTG